VEENEPFCVLGKQREKIQALLVFIEDHGEKDLFFIQDYSIDQA